MPFEEKKREQKKEEAAFAYLYAATTTPNQQNEQSYLLKWGTKHNNSMRLWLEKMFEGLYTSSMMKA